VSDRPVLVYGLFASNDPNREVRYVGVTSIGLDRRLKKHLSDALKGEPTYKARWVRKVLESGGTVTPVVLHTATQADWPAWERFLISWFPRLTNATAGGEGLLNPTSETRERMRVAHLGKTLSEETRRKLSEARRGNKHNLGKRASDETRAKLSAQRKGKPRGKASPGEAARLRALAVGNTNRKGKKASPETLERMRRASMGNTSRKGKFLREGTRNRNFGVPLSDEHRAKLSAAAKARHAAARAAKTSRRETS